MKKNKRGRNQVKALVIPTESNVNVKWWIFAIFLVMVFSILIIINNVSEKVLLSAINEQDGCSLLSNDQKVKLKNLSLESDISKNFNVTLKELEIIRRGDIIAVPGAIINLTYINNDSSSYLNDVIRFTDIISSSIYTATISSEGQGIITIAGNIINLSYVSNLSQDYVSLDFPQTTTTFLTFNCSTTSCTPNWAGVNTNCRSNETIIIWYNDTNNCNDITSRPANITRNCDYDNNGIIGDNSSIQSNMNITIYINSELLNLTKNYTNTKTIEIRNNNVTRVRFDYSFSNPLDLKSILINQQSSGYGFIIVEGINVTKKVYLDIINSTNKVCIKNSHVTSISDISNNCTYTNEFIINCPGTNYSYGCNISSNFYEVSGLTNSAVKEFTSSCTPNWSCTDWSPCITNIHVKVCIDTNNCGVLTGKPIESEACIPPCTPNWNCTWIPKICPKNETQIKSCIDLNNCGTTDMPVGTRACAYTGTPIWLWILLGIAVLIIIVLVILVIVYETKKKPYNPLPHVSTPILPPPTPQYTNYPRSPSSPY